MAPGLLPQIAPKVTSKASSRWWARACWSGYLEKNAASASGRINLASLPLRPLSLSISIRARELGRANPSSRPLAGGCSGFVDDLKDSAVGGRLAFGFQIHDALRLCLHA